MVRQQRASKVHEDRYPSCHRDKDELVKRDMLDPPKYLRRSKDIRGKALSFGVLDWNQLENWKDSSTTTTLEGTKGVCCSYASSYDGSVETASSSLELDLSTGVVKRLDLDSKHDVFEGECSSPVNVTSKKGRNASPNRRFSFSFSQMGRSFSSKESTSSVPASSNSSHASAKSGPLTFNDSKKPNNGQNRTKSGPLLKLKTEKNVTFDTILPTMEKKQRSQAILQYTLRKGINLFQFVVDNNKSNNVLAATMKKSSDSSTRSYTLYSINEVKNKTGNWLNRHKNEDPFVHTIIGQMKAVSDLATHKSESVLYGVETEEEEIAAIVQTRNKRQRCYTTNIILPSGVHTLPKDGNTPLPLINRWKYGCDCGGWDIGCKLRVLSNDHIKSQSFSSFQLFDQERDEPAFKMVKHDNELHSVEFGSSISVFEAFFISLATVSSHQSWSEEEEEEEEEVVIGDFALLRETSTKYASNPPVSPIGRV